MDSKSPPPAPMPPLRRSRPLAIAALVAVCLFLLLQTSSHTNLSFLPCTVSPAKNTNVGPSKVPLEAHIMSKCPDARDCLKMLILPAMQQIHSKVDWKLSFIGKPTDNDGVECKHGPAECLGNIIMLCAAQLYPDPKTSLGFTMCLERDYGAIADRNLVEDCALEHAVDINALSECATKDYGAYGMHLLRESVQRTSNAGVVKSCTIRLNNENYCIRDGGKWYNCPHGSNVTDLVREVEKLSSLEL